jgi:hypothetical protein
MRDGIEQEAFSAKKKLAKFDPGDWTKRVPLSGTWELFRRQLLDAGTGQEELTATDTGC